MAFEYNIDQLERFEQKLLAQDYLDSSFIVVDGDKPLIISCPHSVPQTRGDRIKLAETRTAIFGCILNLELDVPLIFKTKNCKDDANFDLVCKYKDTLVKYINEHNIKCCVDLHIMKPNSKFDTVLGVNGNENLCGKVFVEDIVEGKFKEAGYNVGVDEVFKASHKGTVSNTVSRVCGVPAIQIELCWDIIDTWDKVFNITELLKECLEEILSRLEE